MEQEGFYQKLRAQFDSSRSRGASCWPTGWKDLVLAVPDFFHLLICLAADDRVPLVERAKVTAAIAYFINPFDVLPKAILGPVGSLDALAVAAWAIQSMLKHVDSEVIEEHWAGNGQAVEAVAKVLELTRRLLGVTLYRRAVSQFARLGRKFVISDPIG
jgi:uncharacterized membrane protein YkvA (DUF1232 family)